MDAESVHVRNHPHLRRGGDRLFLRGIEPSRDRLRLVRRLLASSHVCDADGHHPGDRVRGCVPPAGEAGDSLAGGAPPERAAGGGARGGGLDADGMDLVGPGAHLRRHPRARDGKARASQGHGRPLSAAGRGGIHGHEPDLGMGHVQFGGPPAGDRQQRLHADGHRGPGDSRERVGLPSLSAASHGARSGSTGA